MFIEFKRIRYKNLLSSGNKFTEICLNNNKTTLISGKNGSGKSTMTDALMFVLYGKPHRKINKPQLLNSINQKELVVELEFSIGKNEFKIIRGMKPNIFEIWKNDSLLNQDAASRDYQSYLENNILKMNYKSSSQIMILGSATYVSFMELTTGARREIIEDLLDIQIFTTMNSILKEKISDNKSKISSIKNSYEILKAKLDSAKENTEAIKKIKEEETKNIKQKILDEISNIETYKKEIHSLGDKIEELKNDILDENEIKTLNNELMKNEHELKFKRKMLLEENDFYQCNDSCPTCKQNIESSFKNTITKSLHERIQSIDFDIEKINVSLLNIRDKMNFILDIKTKITSLDLKINEYKSLIKSSKNALNYYKNDLTRNEEYVENIDLSKIENIQAEMKTKIKETEGLIESREIYAVIATMLKDGGIKSRIIKQYIPIMNKLINKYLAAFDLYVDFQLDENFNEVIKSRYRDNFSYSSFSEGEKLRISLAIMLTWRAVAKLRNSVTTNLLILDETLDGSLDAAGIENLIDTIKTLNNNDNIFVISHRGDSFKEKFDHHLEFKKVKNFSVLEEEGIL